MKKVLLTILLLVVFMVTSSVALATNYDVNDETLHEGETKTYFVGGKDFEVTLNFVDSDEAQFVINGETTQKINEGDKDTLSDGTMIGVTEIYYEDIVGGIMKATFFMEAGHEDCEDSDGRDYSQKGKTTGTKLAWSDDDRTEFEDSCVDFSIGQYGQVVSSCDADEDCKISEWYCKQDTVSYEYIECPYGCSNGACKEQDTESKILHVLHEGETKTYTLDGKDFEVTLNFVDSDEAQFVINGETTQKINEGDTDTLSDGTPIGVTDIYYENVAWGIRKATFFVGHGQGAGETDPACTQVWDPVCGEDGVTYSNDCFAKFAGVDIDHSGTCMASKGMVIGDEDADITMYAYVSFQEPFTARWYEDTLPLIEDKYIDSEELRIEFKHFPLVFHPNAFDRSLALECVGQQGLFSEFADEIIPRQSKTYDLDDFIDIGEEFAAFDEDEFEDCFRDDDTEEDIKDETEDAEERGISGTPTFFIDDKKLAGAQPYQEFVNFIEGKESEEPSPGSAGLQKEPVLGSKNAEVTIVGYFGYNDPFSQRVWPTIQEIVDDYEGKVNLQFVNYPLVFQDPDYEFAMAGECVLDKAGTDAFFDFSQRLFSAPQVTIEDVYDIGQDMGVELMPCVERELFKEEVLNDIEKGDRDRVTGTPHFEIEGITLVGAQSSGEFTRVIDSLLGPTPNPTCTDGVKNQGEQGVDCGGPCKECTPSTTTCNGCLSDSTCLPFGTRLVQGEKAMYCDITKKIVEQKDLYGSCQNDYECSSNQCIDGSCGSLQKELRETRGVIERFFKWLDGIF